MSDHRIPSNKFYVALPEDTILSKEWQALMPTTRCLYLAMLTRYTRTGKQANGHVTWSQVELVAIAGLSLRTINRGIKELLEKEWMTTWEPGGRWAKGTTYELNPRYADGETPEPT